MWISLLTTFIIITTGCNTKLNPTLTIIDETLPIPTTCFLENTPQSPGTYSFNLDEPITLESTQTKLTIPYGMTLRINSQENKGIDLPPNNTAYDLPVIRFYPKIYSPSPDGLEMNAAIKETSLSQKCSSYGWVNLEVDFSKNFEVPREDKVFVFQIVEGCILINNITLIDSDGTCPPPVNCSLPENKVKCTDQKGYLYRVNRLITKDNKACEVLYTIDTFYQETTGRWQYNLVYYFQFESDVDKYYIDNQYCKVSDQAAIIIGATIGSLVVLTAVILFIFFKKKIAPYRFRTSIKTAQPKVLPSGMTSYEKESAP